MSPYALNILQQRPSGKVRETNNLERLNFIERFSRLDGFMWRRLDGYAGQTHFAQMLKSAK